MSPNAHAAHLRANLLLTLTAAIWGFSFVAQRVGSDHLGPFAFNGVRFALGSASLIPLILVFDRLSRSDVQQRRRAGRSALLPGVLAGSVLFVASALQQAGVADTTAGKASFVTGLYIVVVPILGLALGHRVGRLLWCGVALAVAGLYLLTMTGDFTLARGDGLVLIGTLFWAIHILVIDRYTGRNDALRLSAVQFATCSALSLASAVAFEDAPFAGLSAAWGAVLYGGFMAVGIAYTLQVVAQKEAKASHAAIILSTEAVFGAIGGALLLGESMTARGYVGCALMMAGILLSQAAGSGKDDAPATPMPEPPVPVDEG